jgi:hypothetical protein
MRKQTGNHCKIYRQEDGYMRLYGFAHKDKVVEVTGRVETVDGVHYHEVTFDGLEQAGLMNYDNIFIQSKDLVDM